MTWLANIESGTSSLHSLQFSLDFQSLLLSIAVQAAGLELSLYRDDTGSVGFVTEVSHF